MSRLALPPGDASSGFDRQPPWSPEAEVSVLGGMLFSPEAVDEAAELLRDSMFYREAHRRLFRAVVELRNEGKGLDPVTLQDHLQDRGEWDAVGGWEYVSGLLDAVPTAANLRYHAEIVREKAMLRGLIDRCTAAIRDAYDPGDRAAGDVVAEAEGRLMALTMDAQSDAVGVPIKQHLMPTFERIERWREQDGPSGLPTGFADLDRLTAGLHDGDLVVVAGRPSMGKTAWALDVVRHVAVESGVPVWIKSMEMRGEELTLRLISSHSRVPMQKLRTGKALSPEEERRLAATAARINLAPIIIDDSPSDRIGGVRAKARRAKQRHGVGLVVVDYMQLMEGGDSGSRVTDVSEMSRGLKVMARELDVPVIAISQLSRGPENRSTHRPMISDLRESGSIEQDADAVFLLFRPEYYLTDRELANKPELKGAAQLIIGKQRNGPTETVRLHWDEGITRFSSWAHKQDQERADWPRFGP